MIKFIIILNQTFWYCGMLVLQRFFHVKRCHPDIEFHFLISIHYIVYIIVSMNNKI